MNYGIVIYFFIKSSEQKPTGSQQSKLYEVETKSKMEKELVLIKKEFDIFFTKIRIFKREHFVTFKCKEIKFLFKK